MKTDEKIVYYADELNDDFSPLDINEVTLDKNYKYIHTNWFFKIFEFLEGIE